MSDTLIVIPARYASSRLPGKPLLDETGKPLIQHTVEAASSIPSVKTLVATDDERIQICVEEFGGEAIMTSPTHESGTDRVAEAARQRDAEIIVNVQGDEPEIEPEHIKLLIETHRKAMSNPKAPAFASTLVCPFPKGSDPKDPNMVKAVLAQKDPQNLQSVLYFSRSAIPFERTPTEEIYLHIGIYAFSASSLQTFPRLPRTPLEKAESLEQLRILEHGHRLTA
ncbi:MAG: 3-deoxy-manno-octulosonate cytidylyltransferase, partial [Pseudomonadota bacterium]